MRRIRIADAERCGQGKEVIGVDRTVIVEVGVSPLKWTWSTETAGERKKVVTIGRAVAVGITGLGMEQIDRDTCVIDISIEQSASKMKFAACGGQ